MEDSTSSAKADNMLDTGECKPKLFTFMESLSSCLQNFWVFKGRATRAEFWYIQPIFVFIYQIMAIVLVSSGTLAPYLFSFAIPDDLISYLYDQSYYESRRYKYKIYTIIEIVFYVFLALYAAIFIADSALITRRLHDIGRSGFMQFLYAIPLLVGVSLIGLAFYIKYNYFMFFGFVSTIDIMIAITCIIPIIILKSYLVVLYCFPSEPRENRFGKVRTALIKSK